MARGFPISGVPGVLLFGEDFDLPPPRQKPDEVPPVYSVAEMTAAREEAGRDSRDRTLAEVEGSTRAALDRTLAEIAAQLIASRAEAASIAEQSAEAIARLLLDCLTTAFPALNARIGPRELIAVLREILPTLHREPNIVVRINPNMLRATAEEIDSLDADLAARVRLVPTDAVAPGDARVSWENGTATRDGVSLWKQIESILAPAGLLDDRLTAKEDEVV